MNTKQITVDGQQNALAAMKAALFGRYTDVAKKAGVSTTTVTRVLDGEWDNEKVIKAAKKMIAKIEKEKKRYAKLIA